MDGTHFSVSSTQSDQGKRTTPLRKPTFRSKREEAYLTPRRALAAPCESQGLDLAPLSVLNGVERGTQPCAWAAELGGLVVGVVGLVPVGEHTACIHWLHIEPDWQHTEILSKLLRQLQEYCQSHGYWRLALTPEIAPPWIWRLLVRCGFRLLRRIRSPQGEVLEFALDHTPAVSTSVQPSTS